MVSSLGVGSGLDLQSLVNQLIAAERQPALGRLNVKEARFQARLSAFGNLKSTASKVDDALQSLRNIAAQRTARTTNGDGILNVTAGEAAVPGGYLIQSQQLASSQGLASIALASADTVVGAGTLTIERGTTDYDPDTDTYTSFTANGTAALTLEFTDDQTTLADIRDAINTADAGITAAIVTDNEGTRLALSSSDTGLDNTIRITVEEPDPSPTNIDLDGLSMLAFNGDATNLVQTVAAQDAVATINGLQVTSSTNKFSEAIQGLEFELISVSEDDINVIVENDDGRVATVLRELIDAYNEFADFASDAASYNAETQQAGVLFGDSTLRSLRSVLRRGISGDNGGVDPNLRSLLDVGIDFDESGKLELDQDQLSAQIDRDFGSVISFLQAAGESLQQSVEGFVAADGLISARTEGLNARIQDIGDQRQALDRRTEVLEKRYTAQFAALDTLLAGLESTSNFLTQQLANLNVNPRNSR